MAAIKLPEGEQVQHRRQQPEPGGKSHRVKIDRVSFRGGPQSHPRGELKQERLAELEADEVGRQHHDPRQAQPHE